MYYEYFIHNKVSEKNKYKNSELLTYSVFQCPVYRNNLKTAQQTQYKLII